MVKSGLASPIALFTEWFEEASQSSRFNPNAAALATAALTGRPSVRIILVKSFGEDGFVFYTNLNSRKGLEIAENPQAALCFYWPRLSKQVRIEGPVAIISDDEADQYFASRERESKIVAWAAANQLQPMESTAELYETLEEYTQKFNNIDIPRPAFWSGFRLQPDLVEFWKAGAHRLHERICYKKKEDNSWESYYLNP